MQELNAAWTAASEDIYKSQQEQSATGNEQQPGNDGNQQQTAGAEDNVTDVPFEEVNRPLITLINMIFYDKPLRFSQELFYKMFVVRSLDECATTLLLSVISYLQ